MFAFLRNTVPYSNYVTSLTLFLRWRVCFFLLGCPTPLTLPPTSTRSPTMTIVNMETLPLPWKFRWKTTPGKSAAFLHLCFIYCHFQRMLRFFCHRDVCTWPSIFLGQSIVDTICSQSGWEWNKTDSNENAKLPWSVWVRQFVVLSAEAVCLQKKPVMDEANDFFQT